MNNTNVPQANAVLSPVLPVPAGPQAPSRANSAALPNPPLPVVDPLLFVHATAHTDLERLRIASENRLRILTTTVPDDDGVMRGFGLSESHPDVARLAGIAEALVALEHDAELGLKRALRRCALHPWVKAQVGLGEKQVARLLGSIGDPYWHMAEDRPRTVSELWAYSGLHVLPTSRWSGDTHIGAAGGDQSPASHPRPDAHIGVAGGTSSGVAHAVGDAHNYTGGNQASDPGRHCDELGSQRGTAGVAARRRKGQRANWSTDAKMRAYLCATSCIKQTRSPYRDIYLARREHTAVTHPDWTAGHSHNDGLRITSKAILRDLWRESRRLHGHAEQEVAA